ncbi:ABC transporter substrate-binding protein [Sphingomonas sp. M1-B02]|uniref:ABC transporter substrate-binding protein n=1 Tax=Sphingomonas sp. M1-B02 TaxID=3114300 RepID=UPI0022405D1C|nr:ABC transporter substrate-binding protein [Sphingomonas sp. S6-11]UZK64929.1 ABC transporter substrate-binding protein [Sphingomonas sp. S6-11]
MAALPRVVSLLPSATEIAVAVGLGEQLLGRSHECDFPPFVAALPVLTSTKLEKGLTSLQIDRRVQEIVQQGLSVYAVDSEQLRALRPDVILTQSQCAVCAVTPADLEDSLAAWVGTAPTLVSLAPDDLGDVWGDFARVGEAVGAEEEAERAVERLRARLDALQARTAGRGLRPTVAAIEWIDPLMVAGNWVPELIELAGGEPLFAVAGQHSPWLEWDTLIAADPDVIVMMPCGYRIPQTLGDLAPLVDRPGWRDLSAVRQGRVFVADGHHFFNRPGPRLVESAEIIAQCLDDNRPDPADRRWLRLPRRG